MLATANGSEEDMLAVGAVYLILYWAYSELVAAVSTGTGT